MATEYTDEEIISAGPYGCIYVLANDYATLEATLADEVAENVRLRSREVGDEVGNLLQEVADLKNELARIQAGPHFVQYVDRLNEIYRRRREGGDDAERFLAIDELCRKLANESDEFMAQRDEARAELARVKAESLRVVTVHKECTLADMNYLPVDVHTNLCTACGVDWRIYAAERRTDDAGHRYLMPVSDQWPPIPMPPDTIVQPVRLERWEDEG